MKKLYVRNFNIVSLRSDIEKGFIEKCDNLCKEKETIEKRFMDFKFEHKEIISKYIMIQKNLEDKIVILEENNSNQTNIINELKERSKTVFVNKESNISKEVYDTTISKLESQINDLKENLSLSKQNLIENQQALESQKILYENKLGYLDNLKESYKKQLQDSYERYEENIRIMQINSKLETEKIEKSYKSLLESLEINYKSKIDESERLYIVESQFLKNKLSDYEEELKKRDNYNKSINEIETEFLSIKSRYIETDNELRNLKSEYSKLIKDHESKIMETISLKENEKEYLKKKINDLEKRIIEIESLKSSSIIEIELEKSRASLQIDNLNNKISELEDNIKILEYKNTSLILEIEKLKKGGSSFSSKKVGISNKLRYDKQDKEYEFSVINNNNNNINSSSNSNNNNNVNLTSVLNFDDYKGKESDNISQKIGSNVLQNSFNYHYDTKNANKYNNLRESVNVNTLSNLNSNINSNKNNEKPELEDDLDKLLND